MTTWITDNGITVLSPADGMRLTDGETVAEGDVFLAANAAPDAWREVTEAEAEEIRAGAERMMQSEEEWKAAAKEWRTTAMNNSARVERVNAALDEKRSEYIEKRDAVVLPSTKAIYQAFIDSIDRIKELMEMEGEGN